VDPYFKELFTFTSGEKKGLFILSVVVFLLLSTLILLPFFQNQNAAPTSDWIKEMSGLDLTYVSDTSTVSDSLKGEEGMPPKPELFEFDPNLATGEMFHALGLASWQIQIIERYRIKGGKFRNAEDFASFNSITFDYLNLP